VFFGPAVGNSEVNFGLAHYPAGSFRAQSIALEFMISLGVFGTFFPAYLAAIERWQDAPVQNVVKVERCVGS